MLRYAKTQKPFPMLMLMALAITACSDQRATPFAPSFSEAPFSRELASPAWQARARALVVSNSFNPVAATRVYSALSVAQYGAVVDANDQSDAEVPGEGFGAGGRNRYEAERGAVAGASAQVLSFFFPAAHAALEQSVVDEGNTGPGDVHPQFERGVAIGRLMGDAMVERARNDGFTAVWTGTLPVGPGMWISNGVPFGPQIPAMTPYFMTSSGQFHSTPPPAFGSAEFLAALAEIKDLSLNRTPEQLASARALNLSSGTITTLGFFIQRAGEYIFETELNERAATHIFALTAAATWDAVLGCWEAKYSYTYIRPSQATTGITLPIGLPNHPSYPSGHSCVSAA